MSGDGPDPAAGPEDEALGDPGDGLDMLLSMSAEPLSPEDELDEATVPVVVQHDADPGRRLATPGSFEPPPLRDHAPPPAVTPAAVTPSPPLPRRMPGGAAPMWGPRDHPPPVQAPPPPHPLDAPRPSRPLDTPDVPARPVAPAPVVSPRPGGLGAPVDERPVPERPVPERPSHPRVRRWFGRGSADTTPDEPEPPTPESADGGGTSGTAAPASLDPPPAPLVESIEPSVPAEPDLGPGGVDPWNLELAVGRLSAGARRTGAVALGVLSTVLEEGEQVELVVQGRYQHHAGVVALTRGRVIVLNERHWVPDVRVLPITAGLVVQGWQDERQAALAFADEGSSVIVSEIADRPLAQDLARRVRELVAGAGGPAR